MMRMSWHIIWVDRLLCESLTVSFKFPLDFLFVLVDQLDIQSDFSLLVANCTPEVSEDEPNRTESPEVFCAHIEFSHYSKSDTQE